MTETKEEKSDISGKFLDLYEIRKELVNIEYSLSLIRKNCTTLEINLKKSEVVQKALEKLDDKTKIYESCGRIFALSSKDEVLNNLKNNKKEMIKELDAQNEKKKNLENNLKEKSKEYDEEQQVGNPVGAEEIERLGAECQRKHCSQYGENKHYAAAENPCLVAFATMHEIVDCHGDHGEHAGGNHGKYAGKKCQQECHKERWLG